jgi:hypothetical protein
MGQRFTLAEAVELETLLRVGCCCTGPSASICPIHVSRELVRAIRKAVTSCAGCREKKQQIEELKAELEAALAEASRARLQVLHLEDGALSEG